MTASKPMTVFYNGVTFTELWHGEEIAMVHADAKREDVTDANVFEIRLFNGEIEDYVIPSLFAGHVYFELGESGETAITTPLFNMTKESTP